MAPEYVLHGLLSVKSDVFSYGVLVLEIVSGRKNQNPHLGPEMADLLNYVSWIHNITLFGITRFELRCNWQWVHGMIHILLILVLNHLFTDDPLFWLISELQ